MENDIVIGIYKDETKLMVKPNGRYYWFDIESNKKHDSYNNDFAREKITTGGVFLRPERWKVLGRDF